MWQQSALPRAPTVNYIPHLARRALPGCLALGLSALAGTCAAQSADGSGDTLRFSGFGSFGVAHVDAPEGWVYRRELSQPLNSNRTRLDLDSRLGLQVNYTPSSAFELVGQAILMRRAEGTVATAPVEWAFAAYRPNADWTLRLGRVNGDAFLVSDHRSVGFAYPFARPPVDFYSQVASSLDGADATWVLNSSNAQWRAKVFAGKSKFSIDNRSTIDLRGVLGGMVSHEAQGLLTRFSVYHARVSVNVPALQPLFAGLDSLNALPVAGVVAQASELRTRLTLNDVKHTYVSFGARYDEGDWLLSGELMRVTGSVQVSLWSGYASLGRRLGPVTVFGVVSRAYRDSPLAQPPAWQAQLAPVIGPAAAQQIQSLGSAAAQVINGMGTQQTTLSLGTRWDLGDQLALKLQWDYIRVAANGSSLWGNASTQATRANVGSVVLDFIF